MTRARRRIARSETADHDWERRRPAVLAYQTELETFQEFWTREAGIPARLRRRITGYVAEGGRVLAPDPDRLIKHLEARRRWLVDHDYPAGIVSLTQAEPVR